VGRYLPNGAHGISKSTMIKVKVSVSWGKQEPVHPGYNELEERQVDAELKTTFPSYYLFVLHAREMETKLLLVGIFPMVKYS
jgi:hypothetical protein